MWSSSPFPMPTGGVPLLAALKSSRRVAIPGTRSSRPSTSVATMATSAPPRARRAVAHLSPTLEGSSEYSPHTHRAWRTERVFALQSASDIERFVMSLKNKVAIVTGRNSGIGQAIVLELARLVDAGGQSLATSSMRDGVWDLTASHQSEYKEYSLLRRDDGGTGRHLTTFRSGLGLRTYGATSNRYRLAVKIRQSTVARRRPEST
jgi:hypothetical protein